MNPKVHLVFHCVVLAALLVAGAIALRSGMVHFSLHNIARASPFALAAIFAVTGIWETARYRHNIARGCEITVTTAGAMIFPHLGYLACAVMILFDHLL